MKVSHILKGIVITLILGLTIWKQGDASNQQEVVRKYKAMEAAMEAKNMELVWALTTDLERTGMGYNKAVDSSIMFFRGIAAQRLGKFETSIECLNKSLKSAAPDFSIHIHRVRSTTYFLMGKYPEALSDLEKAFADDPEQSTQLNNIVLRANILYRMKDYERSIIDYRKALSKVDPKNSAELQCRVGFCLQKTGKAKEAFTIFQKARKLDPQCSSAFIGVACLYRDQKKFDKALALFDKALAIVPTDEEVFRERAALHDMRGDEAAAAKDRQLAAKYLLQ